MVNTNQIALDLGLERTKVAEAENVSKTDDPLQATIPRRKVQTICAICLWSNASDIDCAFCIARVESKVVFQYGPQCPWEWLFALVAKN